MTTSGMEDKFGDWSKDKSDRYTVDAHSCGSCRAISLGNIDIAEPEVRDQPGSLRRTLGLLLTVTATTVDEYHSIPPSNRPGINYACNIVVSY